MTYRIHPLPLAPFRALIDLDDRRLAAQGARRMVADTPASAPCRVSLVDAERGERLLLLNHAHLDVPASPYRSAGPIFVREAAVEAGAVDGTVPEMIARRLLSVRAYDADWMMTDADVVEGRDLDARLRSIFADQKVADVHIHTARRGCYLARATRAEGRGR